MEWEVGGREGGWESGRDVGDDGGTVGVGVSRMLGMCVGGTWAGGGSKCLVILTTCRDMLITYIDSQNILLHNMFVYSFHFSKTKHVTFMTLKTTHPTFFIEYVSSFKILHKIETYLTPMCHEFELVLTSS